MDNTVIENPDQPKKSSRNKTKKNFDYADFQEEEDDDSPKRKYKKRLKDKKLSSVKKSKQNGDYDEDDEINKKPKKKVKLNPEEIKLIRRLKRTSKPTFNPKLLEESKIKRDTLAVQLKELEDKYGKFQPKLGEPKQPHTSWDYIMKEMVDVANFFMDRRKWQIFKGKKLVIGARFAVKNRIQAEIHRTRDEQFKLMRIGNDMHKMVQREFWKNIQKIKKYQIIQAQQEMHMKSQQKRLESFVNKQLKLSSKMADFLQQEVAASEKGSEGEEEVSEEEEDEEETEKQIIINLGKNENGYFFEDYQVEEISLEVKKDNLKEIANQLAEYQPQGFTLNSVEVKVKQPFLIKGTLREYQMIGLNWLVMLYQKKINGILADEMGLGKTIQTISLLAHLACEKGIWGPHLIVVPTSILVNWEIEFKRWCPALKVMTYFGSPKERKAKRMGWSRVNFFHVCITSYKLALQDKKIFRRKRWYYMILDEAHNIKNFKSQRWQTLLGFHSKRRLLITGTPLQNDVSELWSLMHFLMPHIFHSNTDFNEWFLVPMQQAMQNNQPINMTIIQQLHSILRPFLLRRLKKDVEKQLPSKTEVIIRCPLSRRQKYLYDEFINKDETKGKIKDQEFLGLMNVLMQLRKVCNHPDLFDARAIESGIQMPKIRFSVPTLCLLHYYYNNMPANNLYFNLFENEFNVRSTYNYQRVLKLLPGKSELQKIFVSNMGAIDSYKGHFSYKWKKIKTSMRNQNVERTFIRNYMLAYYSKPVYGLDTIEYFQNAINIDQKENFIREYGLVKSIEDRIFDMKEILDHYVTTYNPAISKTVNFYPSKFTNDHERISQAIETYVTPNLKTINSKSHFPSIRMKLLFPDKKFLIYDCGKLNSMMHLLSRLKAEKHKVLIFTQMSKMLDLFEFSLNIYHMTYVRLDGATRPDVRQKLVERFNQDPKIFCFISSTRSGGIGINLTGADCVIFYDTDWNPAMDRQAQDRCHRIGQTRNVTIYRLISEYTIEENILLKNMQKRKLDEYIMEEGQFNMEFFEKISMKDVLGDMLFSGDNKMSYKQFEKALERVEDADDVMATKNATKEQEDVVLEDVKVDPTPGKGDLENENPPVERSMLPPLYNYGLDLIEYLVGGTGLDFDEEEEEEKKEQDGGMREEEEEEVELPQNFHIDSDDEGDAKNLSKKDARKAYQETKKLIVRNYYI